MPSKGISKIVFLQRDSIMKVKFPSMNQVITVALALVIIGFIIKILPIPENIRVLFRV